MFFKHIRVLKNCRLGPIKKILKRIIQNNEKGVRFDRATLTCRCHRPMFLQHEARLGLASLL